MTRVETIVDETVRNDAPGRDFSVCLAADGLTLRIMCANQKMDNIRENKKK